MTTTNTALADELEAVNSIYDANTLSIISTANHSTSTILTLPTSPFSFNITFADAYPEIIPHINGTQSTGPNTKKGEGDAVLNILRDVLDRIFVPGQVCLFDLIEEITPLLQSSDTHAETDNHTTGGNDAASEDHGSTAAHRSATPTPPLQAPLLDFNNLHIKDLASDRTSAASKLPEPNWTLSQPLLVSKSSFIARAVQVHSLHDATTSIGHLLSTNKKVASATHNITAWRIRSRDQDGPEITVQDCDDDGETAAGGRLLHLMQLMDVWNVVVVVTRWYGGVKLGTDRFRCINMVARDALVQGGFAKEERTSTAKGKGRRK